MDMNAATGELSVRKLYENIWKFHDENDMSSVDGYLVVGEKKAVMIDGLCFATGLLDAVKEITKQPLFMLVTHGHPDHAGSGMTEFYKAGVPVYMSHKDDALLVHQGENRIPAEGYLELSEGMEFDLGGTVLKTVALPGHTPGSQMLFDEKNNRLYSSDAFGSGSIWMQLRESLALPEYYKNLERFMERFGQDRDIELLSGHTDEPLSMPYIEDIMEETKLIMEGKLVGEPYEVTRVMLPEVDARAATYGSVSEYCYDADKISQEK